MVFLLFIYALVIVACLKLRGKDERPETYRANTPLLIIGIVGNLIVLVVHADRRSGGAATGWPACWPSASCCTSPRSSSVRTSYAPRAPSLVTRRPSNRPANKEL